MNKELTWRDIKALHQLHHTRQTRAQIQKHPYIEHLFSYPNKCLEYVQKGSKKVIVPTNKFDIEYAKQKIEQSYIKYDAFLTENDLLKIQSNYSEFEIRALMTMKNSETILNELKNKIEKGEESRKGVSNLFFKAAKYIQKDSALEHAVLKIIGIKEFPQNENLGFYRVPCINPKFIIICENMYFLTLSIARQHNVELWCAGGNNTKPFENISEIPLPIYYLCDWDYDGLKIYERISDKIECIKDKKTSLQLITPIGKRESIPNTSDYHRSQWHNNFPLSNLNVHKYSNEQKDMITSLISSNEWIEEESNDLLKMVSGKLKP
jgi:5S rRNA maturation endonuclease (ribonuclease M5)